MEVYKETKDQELNSSLDIILGLSKIHFRCSLEIIIIHCSINIHFTGTIVVNHIYNNTVDYDKTSERKIIQIKYLESDFFLIYTVFLHSRETK